MRSYSIRSPLLSLVLAALVGMALACGPYHRNADIVPSVIVFSNQSLDQAAVYAGGAGRDYVRIGTVMSGRTEELVVPAEMTIGGSLNIVARLLARSNVPQTGPISIGPGDRYAVTLTPDGRTMSILPAKQ